MTQCARSAPSPVAGDGLLHPLALAAIALLIVNDHVLKVAAPGLVTGKLSDFAGLAFFPLLLVGLWEWLLSLGGRWSGPSARPLSIAVAASAVGFTLVKLADVGTTAFAWSLGSAHWFVAYVWAAPTGEGYPQHRLAPVVQDPTDLIALSALAVALVIGLGRIRASQTLIPQGRLS